MEQIKTRYRYPFILLKQLVKTDFKLRYQGSALGYLWSLLKPTALFAILYVVFSVFLRIGDAVPNFPVYLLLGIVVWTYFAEVTVTSTPSIVERGDILRKINIPKYIIMLSASFSALINLFLNFIVVYGFLIFNDIPITIDALWLIPLIAELFMLALALSFFLSATFVKLRDVSYIWEVLLQAGFYATPILYPLQNVLSYSDTVAKVLLLNPMAQIIQDMRYVLVTDQSVTIDQAFGSHWYRAIPVMFVVVITVLSAVYFRAKSSSFAEDL